MFFGWYVVVGTFVSQMCLIGFHPFSVSLLVVPVVAEFGATVEQVMYSLTIVTFLNLITLPLAGILIDRYPVRWLMTGGTLLFAGGLGLLSKVTHIHQYVILYAVTISIANPLLGGAISTSTVSRWFTRSRGRALGVSVMGTSAGGMVVPLLVAYWITKSGWRGMLENMALLLLLVVLPIIVLTIRGFPTDIGLEPEKTGDPVHGSGLVEMRLSFSDIIKKPGFWLIGITIGLLSSIYSPMIANLTPYVKSVGIDVGKAPMIIMSIAVSSFVGKLLFGMVADKLSLKLGLWLTISLVIASLLIMAAEPSFFFVEIAAMLLGLSSGGFMPIWGAMMARVFGLLSYGKAMGLMSPLITIIVLPSFSIVGRLFDMSGSYRVCLYGFSCLALVAMIVLIPLRLEGTMAVKKTDSPSVA